MKKVKVLTVNLQEGLLLFDHSESSCTVVGGYSHHCRIVVINAPWMAAEILLPDALTSYRIIECYTDSCGICYWHGASGSDVRAYELNKWFELNVENKGGGK